MIPTCPTAPVCPTCSQAARLTDGREVYPNRPDLHHKPIWKCDGCAGYVGCHPGGTLPLGTPAGPELRAARSRLHEQMLDPLWKTADVSGDYEPEDDRARRRIRIKARARVYDFLCHRLGITRDECHTGLFDIERCRAAWRALQGITYPEIRAWALKQKEAA